MGRIGTCYLMPHPPIIVPEIGRGEEARAQRTIDAMEEVTRHLAVQRPEAIVVITPHGPMFRDAMAVGVQRDFSGDFSNFGQPQVKLSFPGHRGLAFNIMREAVGEGIPAIAIDDATRKRYGISSGLDHGALVPLYFINKNYQGFDIVHITYGMLPRRQLFEFGKCIRRAVEGSGVHAAILCSSDLSHRLTKDAPAGYSKKGFQFDRQLVDHLRNMETQRILEMDDQLVEEAGQCGYRSVLVMLGALDGYNAKGNILSYEGPYGVGYCTGIFEPGAPKQKPGREMKRGSCNVSSGSPGKSYIKGDSYIQLARLALETYVREGRTIEPPDWLPDEMLAERAGVFVSLKITGQLRGCIGTISPTTENIAREIINNAISAGIRDPRFFPVSDRELKRLEYSVDVLGQPEPINSTHQLDVKKYGVIVRSGGRSGLLLPDIEGVDTPQQQVSIALQKAGIGANESYKLERFEVIRHGM